MQYDEGEGKIRYYESPAWGEWCNRVYGKDLKQIGMVTMDDLKLFFREVNLAPNSHILDMGCGPGYITAAVAEHYRSQVTGIDIDEPAISHANHKFSDNILLNFQVADGNTVSFEASSFDLIYFFDTLYFTGTIDKLRTLLDQCLTMLKPGGKLAIFWSSQPMDDLQNPSAGNLQVGKWGVDHRIPFEAFDLSAAHRKFWLKALEETLAMKSELYSEIPETYKQIMNECTHFNELLSEVDSGGMVRYLYIFTKSTI